MEEEIELILENAKELMQKSLDHLENQLLKIRAGKANPSMLDGVLVDYYGSNTPLAQVANVSTPDARTLSIQPWEKGMIEPIEKAIINSNLGLNPQNNGTNIMINVPVLTEERRKGLVKQAKAETEDAKVGIRNARREANDEFKRLEKDGLAEDRVKGLMDEIQEMTDDASKRIDNHLITKEKDIMTV